MGSNSKCGQSYAGVVELPLSSRVREIIEAITREFGRDIPLPDQLSTTNTIERTSITNARDHGSAQEGLVQIHYLH